MLKSSKLIVLPSDWNQNIKIFPPSFIYQHEKGNLNNMNLTFASKEITNSQLAKHDLIIVLDFVSNQLFLAIDKGFWCVFSLRVVESLVNGKLLWLCSRFLLTLWLIQREILRLFLYIKVFDCSSGSINVHHLKIAICHEIQPMHLFTLID